MFQFIIETLLSIHADKFQIIWAVRTKDGLHLIPFIFTKQSMIYKNTGKLLSNRLGQHYSRHRGINSA